MGVFCRSRKYFSTSCNAVPSAEISCKQDSKLVVNLVLSLLVSPSFVFILFFLFARFLFHKNCGQFISLDSNRTTARRVDSYNHGVVLSETPLPDNHLFQVSC